MSNEEWTDLRDLNEVAIAQKSRWKIEIYLPSIEKWEEWTGIAWAMYRKYRGRPAQPKKVTVTSECWRNHNTAAITYTSVGCGMIDPWKRFPAGDITGEVEE
jgi:hypothetical protein